MRAGPLRLFAFALLAAVAACGGQVRWSKAGADEASAGSDLNGCRSAAHSTVQRMYGVPTMSSNHGPFGGSTSDPSLADRQIREQEAVNRCMREKGYTLVPVEG